MSNPKNVAIVLGSLRKAALTRKLALALPALAPAGLKFTVVEIGDLPLYNEDLEADLPPAWKRFREEIRAVDAVLFITPEYNRSVPGGLKNAIDVGSRPYGQSVWSGRPAGVMSVSPGAMGAFGANHALRQSFVFLDMPAMQQPECYLGNAAKLFDASGAIASDESRGFLRKFLEAFAAWVEKNAR
jgi:chromate reductase, NAD(P)H dehydrogenase (quinone)